MSSCTTTVPYSVRNSEPVGQTSRQAACVQCLQTSEDISHRSASPSSSSPRSGLCCSTKATCRHEFAPSVEVLSYDSPVQTRPSSGITFHSLHATSQALQPMQIDVSVKKPMRGCSSSPYVPTTSSSVAKSLTAAPRARTAANGARAPDGRGECHT